MKCRDYISISHISELHGNQISRIDESSPLNPSRTPVLAVSRLYSKQFSPLGRESKICFPPPHLYFPQGHEWIGGSRSDGALGHVSGSGYAATSHRGGHADWRSTLPIDLPELVEQSSQHEPTDQHVEHFEYDESSCWTGNDEIRAEEDDKRVQDQGELWESRFLRGSYPNLRIL